MKLLVDKLKEIKKTIEENSLELSAAFELLYLCEPELNSYTDIVSKRDTYVLCSEERFNQLFERYLSGEPVQYITKRASFLGKYFNVSENVLIPRMETEELVLLAVREIEKKFANYKRPIRIVDLGTGSGVIGLSIANLLTGKIIVDLVLLDVDPQALEVASSNMKLLGIDATIVEQPMDEYLADCESKPRFDVIISNPPYIENANEIDDIVFKNEPHEALLVTPSTKYYEQIIKGSKTALADNGIIIFETGYDQHPRISELIMEHLPTVKHQCLLDISLKPRMIVIDQDNRLQNIVSCLKNDGSIAIPSETVYGLGAIASEENFRKICDIKYRDYSRPFSILMKSVIMAEYFCAFNNRIKRFLKKILPGPITVILDAAPNCPRYLQNSDGTIGVRIADYRLIKEIFKTIEKPLLFTSVNLEGEPTLNCFKSIDEFFVNKIDYIYESYNDDNSTIPSTIIKFSDRIELIREGAIPFKELQRIWEETRMRVVIGSDHGGFLLKESIVNHLNKKGIEVLDIGTHSNDSVNYPDYGIEVAEQISKNEGDLGIVVCSTGEGICIAANKVKGIRCGLIYDDASAALTKEHNNCNVLAFGQKTMKTEDVLRRVDIFLNSKFQGDRHQKRLDIISRYETKKK